MILKNKVSHIGGYFISTFTSSVVTFLSLPLLIRLLGSIQFGKWSLIEPLQLLLSQSILLGIDYGIIKHVNLDKLPAYHVFSKLYKASQPLILASLLMAFLVLRASDFTHYEIVWLLLLIYIESVSILVLSAYRAASLVQGYAIASIAKALIFLTGLFLATTWQNVAIDSVTDVLKWRCIAAVIAIAASLAAVMAANRKELCAERCGEDNSWKLYKNAVTYGLPILVTGLLTMVIEYADRYILKAYFDYVTLTQYVVYLKIASILKPLILTPFALWWVTERFRRMEDADGGKRFFRNTAVWVLLSYLTAGGVLWFFSPWLISWFAPGVPFRADIVLMLIVSVIFMGMAYPLNVGLLNTGKTHLNVYGVLSGALLHIIFCFLLIPFFGIMGAAVATTLSYLAYAASMNMMSQRVYRVPFAYVGMLATFVVAIAWLIIINMTIRDFGVIADMGKAFLFLILLLILTVILNFRFRFAYGNEKNETAH